MFTPRGFVFSAVAAAVVAGCSSPPPPSRAAATPLFNKSGEALCRPEGQQISSTYPANVPICEEICAADSVAGANVAICPPVYIQQRDPSGGGGQDSDRGPTTPRQ